MKTHPRLHAKIYASQTTCIVGSSNASASGLALVLDSPRNWIEANILTDEPAIVEEANALFDDLWHSIECEEITSAALKAAKLRWNHRPSRPSTHVSPSLLDACRANPTKFANVFIAAYDEDLGPSGKEIMKVVRTNQEARAKKLAGRVQRAYGFQFERIDDDCWLIDLDCRKSIAKIWGGGIYRIPDKPSRFCDLADETDLTLGFRASLELPGVVGRLVLTASDKRILIKNASKLLRAGGNRPLPLARAIKITDGPKKSR